MINPNELMLGNYVSDSSTIYKICKIETSGIIDYNGEYDDKTIFVEDVDNQENCHYYEYDLSDLDSIPITKEWLVDKFGFEHYEMPNESVSTFTKFFEKGNYRAAFVLRYNKYSKRFWIDTDNYIEHIHELQNNYFWYQNKKEQLNKRK